MSQEQWQALANFLNASEILPSDGDNPTLPREMYDYEGMHGIAFKFNGGNAKWFTTDGQNAPSDWSG